MVVKAGVHKPMGDVTDATSIFYTVYDSHTVQLAKISMVEVFSGPV